MYVYSAVFKRLDLYVNDFRCLEKANAAKGTKTITLQCFRELMKLLICISVRLVSEELHECVMIFIRVILAKRMNE